MEAEEIKTTLITAAREIIAKQNVLRGEIEVDAYDDGMLPKGWLAGFTMRGGSCVEFRPAENLAEKCNPELLVKLTLTGADGEFRRAVVRGLRGDWQLSK